MKLTKATLAAIGAVTALSMGATPVLATDAATQDEDPAVSAAAEPAEARKGAMIYAEGKRIGQVFRVRQNGDAQVVIRGQTHIVPADTLYEEDGKLVTSLSRSEVIANRG